MLDRRGQRGRRGEKIPAVAEGGKSISPTNVLRCDGGKKRAIINSLWALVAETSSLSLFPLLFEIYREAGNHAWQLILRFWRREKREKRGEGKEKLVFLRIPGGQEKGRGEKKKKRRFYDAEKKRKKKERKGSFFYSPTERRRGGERKQLIRIKRSIYPASCLVGRKRIRKKNPSSLPSLSLFMGEKKNPELR